MKTKLIIFILLVSLAMVVFGQNVSNSLGEVAWYDDNSGSTTHNVATKQSNELGLYDMSGNVWEWCSDWFGEYNSSSQTNPKGAGSGRQRVNRGGCWNHDARSCRSSYRSYDAPAAATTTSACALLSPSNDLLQGSHK